MTTPSPPAGRTPALIRLSSTVVRPKPTRPKAAGFAAGVATLSAMEIPPWLLVSSLILGKARRIDVRPEIEDAHRAKLDHMDVAGEVDAGLCAAGGSRRCGP